jgi:UDP-N-acetylglucosamine diphosphorylase / glucose-1-phosphate thymidylyltransferase / UDP-N-acetylgalactosamine diphosphorylase / glucosamine-1-phosphate N-acetyltransferase / galactosamine-1-phosphate N-acetyltransferase
LSSSSSAFERIVVFDSYLRENFYPLSLARPTFDFLCGTRSLLESIEGSLSSKVTDLIVPKYLEAACSEKHHRYRVNEEVNSRCLAVNSLLSPNFAISEEIARVSENPNGDVIVSDREGNPAFGIFEKLRPEALSTRERTVGVNRQFLSSESSNHCLVTYPWEMVSINGEVINNQAKSLVVTSPNNQGYDVLGSRLHIAESAEVERYVTFDTRSGDIVIDDDAKIQSFSHFTGPAYIGKKTIVKSGKIREGTSVGAVSRVGGEVEECIFSEYVNKNHDGFLGHSIVGSWVNLGALTANSDLKNTYGQIKVKLSGPNPISTGLNKIGCYVGDMAKTAIGTLIMSGKTIGVSSQVFGTVTEDVPSFTISAKSFGKESSEIYIESAIETQRRMMERRGVKMTANDADLIKALFNLTSKDRNASQVKRERFGF